VTQPKQEWIWRVACVGAAAVLLGCPARGAGKGPAGPDGDQTVLAQEKEKKEEVGKGAPKEEVLKLDEAGETEVGEDLDDEAGGGGVVEDAKKKRKKSAEKRRPKPPPPPAPSRTVRAPNDALPGLDLSDEERDALIAPRIARGRKALSRRSYDKAIAEARSVLDVQNENVEAILLLARAYADKGWLPKAERILTTGTSYAAGARSARMWMLLGVVRERSGGDVALARDAYAKAAKLKPNYVKAWSNLGAAQLKLGVYEEAISAFETALSIDSESVVALTNLGTAYRRRASQLRGDRRKQHLRKSENAYRTALAVDEAYAPAHFDLGLLYLDSDEFPGKPPEKRLQLAVHHLREFRRLGGAGAGDDTAAAADEYLETAQRALEMIQRAREVERRRGR